tara:strand:+ start:158 stop:454 length:297 start_codon:yes stop_codon:yes gene_type:complete
LNHEGDIKPTGFRIGNPQHERFGTIADFELTLLQLPSAGNTTGIIGHVPQNGCPNLLTVDQSENTDLLWSLAGLRPTDMNLDRAWTREFVKSGRIALE